VRLAEKHPACPISLIRLTGFGNRATRVLTPQPTLTRRGHDIFQKAAACSSQIFATGRILVERAYWTGILCASALAMTVLETVADGQAKWSATADALKATIDQARRSVFVLSILGALAAALASQMVPGADGQSPGSNPRT